MRFSAIAISAAVLLGALAEGAVAQETDRSVLLETQGILEPGDAVLEVDGSLYDIHRFEGRAGQAIVITAESEEFDTYLWLLDGEDRALQRNDDWQGSTNSALGYVLPEDDVYQVWVNTKTAQGQGNYRLLVEMASDDAPVVVQSRADDLLQQGIGQYRVSQFREALASWQQALELYRQIGDRASEGRTLGNLGTAYRNLGEYGRAIDLAEQDLAIAHEIDNLVGKRRALGNLGSAYLDLGEYKRAIDLSEQALAISRDIGDRSGEGIILSNLGVAYRSLGEYERAIELVERALAISREISDRSGEVRALGNLGTAYFSLGEYERSIDLYEQGLSIAREIGDRAREGILLGNLGSAYRNVGKYERAIDLSEKDLAIAREIGNQASQVRALGNLGSTYLNLGEYERGIDLYRQALAISSEIGDRTGEGILLGNLGIAYLNLGEYERAIDLYGKSLAIARETGDRASEGRALGNLGFLFASQSQSELAIVFYKQSVNVREEIRGDLSNQELLESYTNTVAGTYRALADLLLEQGRILEAQQVLELLKVQELQEFTDDERTGDIARTIPTPEGCDLDIPLLKVSLLKAECDLINSYNSLVKFGQQFRDCETSRCDELADYRRRRNDLFKEYRGAVADLETFIRDRLADDEALLRPTQFATKAQEIIRQQPGTVIVYPLVLEDKLWLLFAADGRLSSRREIGVTQLELGQTVVRFRELLEDRYSNVEELQATGKQLYDWLIAPIEKELGASEGIEHLVFSLDRTTRYIPMAALYDGGQYLTEKYSVTTILSAALTNVDERVPVGTENVPILGAGVSQQAPGFPALPNVPIELDSIIQETGDPEGLYPGRQLLDDRFTFENLEAALFDDGPKFLHIATHGEFVPGNRDASYLLMGNGQKLPIPEIETLGTYLSDVHLAVLSACQTALGGPSEEGLEIAGLGYYFLKNSVDAVMASLWNVNDSSTSQLMQAFYTELAAGTAAKPVTKAEALRAAQLAMIGSSDSAAPGEDRFTFRPENSDAPRPESGLTHPYYWAPFVLIGNGL